MCITRWLCVFLFAFCNPVLGQSAIVHGPSYHTNPGFNNNNYGLGYKTASGFAVGAFKNSEYSNSAYASYDYRLTEYVSVVAGVSTGYKTYPVMPVVMPTASIPFSGFSIVLGVMPYYDPDAKKLGLVVHTMLEFKR